MTLTVSAPGMLGVIGAVYLGVHALHTYKRMPNIRKGIKWLKEFASR